MATVYLAEDLKHHREVAIKVLRHEIAAALGAERFLREIDLAARLRHPHILPLFDSGRIETAEGLPSELIYYVMPFVSGESLRERLQREKQLPLGDALLITRETADALAFAHSQGVVHRDIKPENILLGAGHAVVTDFGIARAISEAAGDRLTATGIAIGTYPYMSPEQAMGERDIDGRTDIYALGCVAYEMLVGATPLIGATAQATVARRMTETPLSIRAVREVIPPSVDQAILRALARAPADRFQTMPQFIQSMEPSTTVPAEVSSPAAPVGRSSWRRFGPAVAVLMVGLVALGAVVLRPRATGGLDPHLLAIAPFDVLSPGLSMWSEGMVDVLSSKLDGVGPLRAAPPSMVIKRWQGRADRGSATALGRSLGAGLTVFGRILPAGRDSVRASATLYDVRADRSLADFEIQEHADRGDRLADALALRLLTELTRVRRIGATTLNSLGSTSPEALKAFLQGERHYRRMSLDSARIQYERAIELDSTFALAHSHLAMVKWWNPQVDWTPDALRAGELNRGLAARESLGIVIDSNLAAPFTGDSASWRQLQRLFAVAEQAVGQYPDDPALQYRLGEARVHQGAYMGETDARAILPFRRAVALDSSFLPAYHHLIALEYEQTGVEAGHRVATAFLSKQPEYAGTGIIQLLTVMLDSVRRRREAAQVLDTTPALDLAQTATITAGLPGSTAITQDLLQALDRRMAIENVPRIWLASIAALMGRFSEAYRYFAETEYISLDGSDVHSEALFSELALLDALPHRLVDSVYRGWLGRDDLLPLHHPFLGSMNGVYLTLPWWSAVGDTLALSRAARTARNAVDISRVEDTAFAHRTAVIAEVYLSLARSDSVEALRRLMSLRDWPCVPCYRDRLLRAQLLAAFHRDLEAARILDQMVTTAVQVPGRVVWLLERGRIQERLGNRARARDAYAYIAAVWAQGDSVTRPLVAEARAGLNRLTGE
jgi:serine/threonine-protein kinase